MSKGSKRRPGKPIKQDEWDRLFKSTVTPPNAKLGHDVPEKPENTSKPAGV